MAAVEYTGWGWRSLIPQRRILKTEIIYIIIVEGAVEGKVHDAIFSIKEKFYKIPLRDM